MTPIHLTSQDLERNLPSSYLARGQQYARQGKVAELKYWPDQNRYAARVEGSSAYKMYRVDVALHAGSKGTQIYGTCSCPMAVNCKHVAAVLLSALDQTSDAEPAPPPPAPAQAALPFELEGWVRELQRAGEPDVAVDTYPPNVVQRLLYVLTGFGYSNLPQLHVKLMTARILKAGGYSSPAPYARAYEATQQQPRFVLEMDRRILRSLLVEAREYMSSEFVLSGASGAGILKAMLATGRCHWSVLETPALRAGPARPGKAAWIYLPTGEQQLRFETEPPSRVALPLSPAWYVDDASGECGPIDAPFPPGLSEVLAAAPVVAPQHAASFRAHLEQQVGDSVAPLPQVPEVIEVRDAQPTPCLRLRTLEVLPAGRYRQWQPPRLVDVAALSFDYAGTRVERDSPGIVNAFHAGKLKRITRNHSAERQAREHLTKIRFHAVGNGVDDLPQSMRQSYVLNDERAWLEFMAHGAPALAAEGWRIEYDEGFRFTPAAIGDWNVELKEAGRDWFDLTLGVDIDGARLDLLPILVQIVRARPELLRAANAPAKGADDTEFVRLDDGKLLPIPIQRLRPVLMVLHELIGSPDSATLRLPRLDAARLTELEQTADLVWQGGENLRKFGSRLANFDGIAPLRAPEGFAVALRPYQEIGLGWLQFLREYELGGILADDMGLGKTVQTLAHISIEKQAGRLDRPALVIAPTSVIPNWKAEAARFAPALRVHVSHGHKRKQSFGSIASHDVVLTTYPLLARDKDALLANEFHLVILDEAQQIKNATTQAAHVVSQLNARHRLCLTGTPLENHLGELWSLFHFLMPGFLGDAQAFRRLYRTPIEKQADDLRRNSLARRVRPFLLRRTKDQVERDLPPKTEIVRPVELAGAQRDLYETVRTSMHERVRAEIAARGLAQSRIVVLDALLKLRQVCCDPRLVKLDAAKAVKESAKLELLTQMLEELLPEGRRVLLFSQFTSMLELIERELAARDIEYLKLTGETRERAAPVRKFQEGKVPLFLISLKAGGTGLNLTAADTVIHYDPWWNPAVEHQATDRAHRIGQTKPVFVYKLIVAGSVEEKIAALQASKAALAAGILGDGAAASAAFTAEDIAALFAPLE